ncbi:hypothetical protein OS493_026724 [Desmophyllum pertusum]|uniref:Uncharacterized protein n=1 Tax=Desmophyllum pertusum TaxID=174260 RepID=A0A9W9ZZS7_9CNID|nr:hypothetical protein OS493_026724 [Desmophyllum pertusum]
MIPSKEEEPPKQLPHVIGMQTGGEAEVKPSPQMDKDENMELPLENDVELNSSEDAMAAEDHLLEPTTTEHELASEEKTTVSKTDQKEPSEDTVTDCNELEGLNAGKTPVTHNTAEATTWATGVPATTQPSISCHMELDDDVVTDGNEDDKKDVASKKDGEEKSTSKGADCQGQHVHGAGARPKELHVPLKKAKTADPSEATEQKATEQADEVAGTNPHGTLFAEFNSGDWNANSKEPTEGAYSGPPTPTGNIPESTIPDENDSEMYSDASPAEKISLIPKGDCGLYSDEEESTGSLQEEPKLTSHGPGKGASTASKGLTCVTIPRGFFLRPPQITENLLTVMLLLLVAILFLN